MQTLSAERSGIINLICLLPACTRLHFNDRQSNIEIFQFTEKFPPASALGALSELHFLLNRARFFFFLEQPVGILTKYANDTIS